MKGTEVAPLATDLLKSLFAVLDNQGAEENEYIMKAIMRSFATLQENMIPFLADLLPKLTEKLTLVAKNPSRPHFNHYLFETLSLSIKLVNDFFKSLKFVIKSTFFNFQISESFANLIQKLLGHLNKHCFPFSKGFCSKISKVTYFNF